ncbi:AbrB/MazE/SpoVT family DNA-binding domain-containing protein [Candidatus Woesearchaeota archaeon]|nr:AbrB/MazE/SpoVT family DNA-binding domain-containing protein [Candidatus Woesearchaeota archaeon]
MAITKVTRNYQITLPKETRKSAGIRIGDEIVLETSNNEIRLKKLGNALENAFGILTEIKEDSPDYVRKIRDESENRRKRLRI